MKLIVSTCGTSLLTNNIDENTRKILNKYTNYSNIDDLPEQDKNTIETHITNRKSELNQTQSLEQICKMSAELNGIIKIYKEQLPKNNTTDAHYLICSDTYLGKKSAEIISNWLKNKFNNVQVSEIKDLKTDSIDNFRSAMSALVKFCYEEIKGYKKSIYRVIFNLTGGFKSVNGVMQTLGMFYADECVYIFETGKELLTIPKLPVKLDIENTVKQNLIQFRKLILGEEIDIGELQNIPETLLLIIDNKASLSVWGELVWDKIKDEIYSERLLDSPIDGIKYSESFINTVNELPADRKKIINKRIDQLYKFIINGTNPNSLDFKKIRNPQNNSTHEFYAWSDKDAKRVYCHYENDNTIMLDKLDDHL